MITGIGATVVKTPLPRPFIAASVHVTAVHDVVVGVEDADGRLGLGYASAFTADRADLLARVVEMVGNRVIGSAPEAWRALHDIAEEYHRSDDVGAGALIETALGTLQLAALELAAIRQDSSVTDLLGGTGSVAHYVSGGSLDASTTDLAAFFLTAVSRDADIAKIKVEGPDVAAAVGRIEGALGVLPDGVKLAIDANQTFDQDSAAELTRRLDSSSARLAWLEEPIDARDIAGLAALRSGAGNISIAAGETLFGHRLVAALLDKAACDLLIVNPTRLGGPGPTLALSAAARSLGVGILGHVYPHIGAHLLSTPAETARVEYLPWWDHHFSPDAYAMTGGRIIVARHVTGFGFTPALREKLRRQIRANRTLP